MSVYLQEFSSVADIEHEYKCTVPADVEILIAWYGYGSYCGDSFVLYRRGGTLYEVNASHCSCYGLEGQWEPEETSVPALRMRTFYNWYDGYQEAQTTLDAILNRLEAA